MSLFGNVCAAQWTIVEADATLTTLLAKATKYKLVSPDLLRKLEYEAAMCPILAMAPDQNGHAWPPARRNRGEGLERRLAVRVSGATAGQDYTAMLTLWEAYAAAIAADLASGSVLKGVGVMDCEYEGLEFVANPNAQSVIESWRFEVTVVHRFRQ
jgi:hypothetical protein